MKSYIVQFDTEVGSYYYAGMKCGVPDFTAYKDRAMRFRKKRECADAIKASHRLDSRIVREV